MRSATIFSSSNTSFIAASSMATLAARPSGSMKPRSMAARASLNLACAARAWLVAMNDLSYSRTTRSPAWEMAWTAYSATPAASTSTRLNARTSL